jgi:hypothetical protein
VSSAEEWRRSYDAAQVRAQEMSAEELARVIAIRERALVVAMVSVARCQGELAALREQSSGMRRRRVEPFS